MLRVGLIGFPGTGKTTLFQLMTGPKAAAHAGHGRTEVALGVSRVPDERLDRLIALFERRKRVPATVEFADVAGAERAGAQTLLDLAPYRDADALIHVLRAFRDPAIPHPRGSIDPSRDARAMEDELILADLGVVERRLERIERDLKKGAGTDLKGERDVLVLCHEALAQGRPLRTLSVTGDAAKRLRGFQFLSAKPLLLVINMDEADVTRVDQAVTITGLHAFLTDTATRAVPVCARIELEIAQLAEDDATAFMAELGLREPGLNRVIRASYDLVGYVSFFTVGEDECRAWSIPRGTHAQLAAGEIHTDIGHGFIRAEVVRYEQLIARGSLAACREYGETRLEGKEYIVADGDVINFRFAT